MSAPIGMSGGSGLYELIDGADTTAVATPFGEPSSPIATGTIAGRDVAFLTRHGVGHTIPPHLINHRANLWALKDMGCDTVITSSAVGSLRDEFAPGDFVVTDQFVDRTA